MNFRTNHSVLCKPKEAFRNFRVLKCSDIWCSHLVHKRKTKSNIKMDKQKVQILLDVLSEVSANFLGAEDLIKERLKEISFREEIPVEEVIYMFFFCFTLR